MNAPATKTIEERLTELEDKIALYDLMNDYQRIADERRYKDWADLWTDDAVFENSFGSLNGKQEIFEACNSAMDVFKVQQHVIGNTRFRITGNEATGTGIVVFTGVPDPEKPGDHTVSGGHYDWRFRKTDAGWKMSYSFLRFIWSRNDKLGMFTTPT